MLGGVFSHAKGFTSINDLWGGLAFHTVSMILGMFCLGQARSARQKASCEHSGSAVGS
ncbi:MAG: hypothetical protein ACYC5J_17040 [Chloroflexota bacterium]